MQMVWQYFASVDCRAHTQTRFNDPPAFAGAHSFD